MVTWKGDFAQRLLDLVTHLAERIQNINKEDTPSKITEYLYSNELNLLKKAVATYLGEDQIALHIPNGGSLYLLWF